MRNQISVLTAVAVVLTGAVAFGPTATAAPAVATAPDPGGYVALDTAVRTANLVTIAAHRTINVRVAGGSTGVPVANAVAVTQVSALNVTAVGALTVYRKGIPRPGTGNVQFTAGKRGSGTVPVPSSTSSGGLATVYNSSSGTVRVTVYVVGYYVWNGNGQGPESYTPATPTRVVNTTLGANRSSFPVLGGKGGLPTRGIGAVAVSFSEFNATKTGGLLAGAFSESGVPQQVLSWPGNKARVGGFAILPTDTDGQIALANLSDASAQIALDVVGWYARGVPSAAGMLDNVPTAPAITSSFAANQTRTVTVAGKAGVPLRNVAAVVLSVLAVPTTYAGAVLASGNGVSAARAVEFTAGSSATNTVVVPVSSTGMFRLQNYSPSSTDITASVVGWILQDDLDVPSVSTSRYLDDLRTDDDAGNVTKMAAHGAADAADDPSLVLLDGGAQSYREPDLSTTTPGVALALTSPTQRLTYPQLVTAVNAYVRALVEHLPTAHPVTVAVGTNNSGNFTDSSDPDNPIYQPKARGTDWANEVVEKVEAPAGVTIVGANDIENGNPATDGFDNDANRAFNWETAYFAAHLANTDGSPDLIFNGSANGCPSVFGSGTTTTTTADNWSLAQFVSLTHKGNRLGVLPQIYYPYMAIQWANIDRVSGSALNFVGSLAQPTAPGSLTPVQSWSALHSALATTHATPVVPTAIDLEPASSAGNGLVGMRGVA